MRRIKEVHVEGFRGINLPLILTLDRPVVILLGPNGAGKTSIFQAIEWCLFGRLDLSGTEFQREDAIVNDFHLEEQTQVTVTLDDGTVIARSRKKKAKTGFSVRDSQLWVTRGREEIKGEEAQQFVSDLLALNADEFGAVTHLRQETIRGFIQGEPAERSRTIDKMIGLFQLRELISGLDSTLIDKEIRALEARVTDIHQSLIQATVVAREMLVKQGDELVADGIHRDQINFEGLVVEMGDISSQLTELARRLDISPPASSTPTADTARQAIEGARKAAHELNESRFRRFREAEEGTSKLSRLRGNFLQTHENLLAVAGLDIAGLRSQHEAAASKKQQLNNNLTALTRRASGLNNLQSRIVSADSTLGETAEQLEKLGSVDQALAQLEAIRREIEEVVAGGKAARALEKLLPAAADFLESVHPADCPICGQEIADLATVVHHLQAEMAASEAAQRAEALSERWHALKDQEREQEQRISAIRSAAKQLQVEQNTLKRLKRELEEATGVASGEPLLQFVGEQLSTVNAQIKEIQQASMGANTEVAVLDGQLKVVQGLHEKLQDCRQAIAEALRLPIEIEDLLSPLQEHIEQSRQQRDELETLTNEFQALEEVIVRADRIQRVLKTKEDLADLEQQYPTAIQEKETLQRAITQLNELKIALQDIYQAATEHQRNIVDDALTALQPVINQYYKKILGHPEYGELQIVPEEEKKGIFRYWIAARNASKTRSTYVHTRFSTAQRNVAAVAVFLAMAERLPHNLNVLMMDDPTQSMDPDHQDAMAKFIAEAGIVKQVIVATEDPSFAERVATSAQNALFHKLEPWTNRGAVLQ